MSVSIKDPITRHPSAFFTFCIVSYEVFFKEFLDSPHCLILKIDKFSYNLIMCLLSLNSLSWYRLVSQSWTTFQFQPLTVESGLLESRSQKYHYDVQREMKQTTILLWHWRNRFDSLFDFKVYGNPCDNHNLLSIVWKKTLL